MRVEVSDVSFLKTGLIDVAKNEVIIPEQLALRLANGPLRFRHLLIFADSCFIELGVRRSGVGTRSIWDQAFLHETDRMGLDGSRHWVLENFRVIRSPSS